VRKSTLVYIALLALVSYGALAMFSEGIVLPGWEIVALLSVLTVIDCVMRSYRWKLLLRHYGMDVSFGEAVKTYLAGLMFILTPAKAGTVVKAELMNKRHGFSRNRTAFLTIVERVFDVLAHVLIAGVAALFVAREYVNSLGILALLMTVGVAALYLFRHKLAFIREELEELRDAKLIATSLIISVASWGIEAFEVLLAASYFGATIGVAQAFFAFSGSLILGNITLLPGGLGATEASMVGLLTFFAVSASAAASITMLVRFTTLWVGFLLGAVFWFLTFHKKL
jgi:uncharacterized membrane protein YbhN (UPF0104 family)